VLLCADLHLHRIGGADVRDALKGEADDGCFCGSFAIASSTNSGGH
jgi:hypothetical protein